VNLPYVISFRSYTDNRGTLTPVDAKFDLPFEIKRVFWVSDFRKMRANHAHREGTQVLIALEGQVAVSVWGKDLPRYTTLLNRRDRGLVIPPEIFLSYSGVPGSLLLVLCSTPWDPDNLIEERSAL